MDFFKKVFDTVGSIVGFGTNSYDDQDAGYEDDRYDGGYAQDGYDNGGYGDAYDDDQGAYEQTYENPRAQEQTGTRRRAASAGSQYEQEDGENVFGGRRSAPRDNVVQMNAERRQQKIRIENLMPEVSNEAEMNHACEILIDRMLQGEIVVISTVNVDDKQRNRMVLMLSGASFAMKATFRRVNAMTYIMVPDGVDVSMDDERPRSTNAFFDRNDFFGGVR